MSTYLFCVTQFHQYSLILPEMEEEVYRQSMNNVQEVSHFSVWTKCGKTDTLRLTFRKIRI